MKDLSELRNNVDSFFKMNHSLEELYLSSNMINDDLCRIISDGMAQNQCVKVLSLSRNHITDISMTKLL